MRFIESLKAAEPLALFLVSEQENGISDVRDWFAEKHLSLPMAGAEWAEYVENERGVLAAEEKIDPENTVFYDDSYIYEWAESELDIYDKSSGQLLYKIAYQTDEWYLMGNCARLIDGILYIGNIYNGYAYPGTCFLIAYDVEKGEVLWRSEDQTYSYDYVFDMEKMETQEQTEGPLTFADFENLEFFFASGAGAWATVMNIAPDGSFSGVFRDSDMGAIGEGYPNGTRYYCEFTGQFTPPEKVNAYTYSMRIAEMSYEKETGTEEIRDSMLYCYSDAFGLTGAEEILIYLPGAPLDELPEMYRSWVGYSNLENTEETELPFYGLYNVAQENGFSSYDIGE